MKKTLKLFLIIYLLFNLKISMAQSWEWAHLLTSLDNSVGIEDISVDKSGNTYIIGYYQNDLAIDSTTIILGDSMDIMVMKANSSGSILWTKSFPYNMFAIVSSVAAKENGGCFITGTYHDSISFDNYSFYDSVAQSFLLNLDSSGSVIWAMTSHGWAGGSSVTFDNSNRPVFTGVYGDSTEIGGIIFSNVTGLSNSGMYVIKMDENGVILWSQNVMGEMGLSQKSLAISEADDIFIAADIYGSSIFGNDTISTVGVALSKFDSSGSFLWVKNIITGNSSEVCLDVDNSNNIYCAGRYESSMNFQNISLPLSVTGGGDFDGFIASYDSAGDVLWANHQYGSGNVWITDICHGNNGLIYFTGKFNGDSIIFSNSTQTIHKGLTEYGQGFFGSSNSAGSIISLNLFNAGIENSIEADSLNNLYLSGNISDTVYMPPFNLPLSEQGVLIAKHQDLFTGIAAPIGNNSFTIWPNPGNGNFNIQTSILEDNNLSIYKVTGELIYNSIIQNGRADLNLDLSLLPGLYFVEMINQREKLVSKLLVY